MSQITRIEQHALIESILEPYRDALGASLYRGYRSHAYRVLNFGASPGGVPDRDERLAVMAAFHDLPFCLGGNLDYLDRAAVLADEWLDTYGRAAWRDEIRLMIGQHHRIRPYRGPSASLVEATRKADWIDVSLCALRFGLPRTYVRGVASAFPLDGFWPRPAWPMVFRYAATSGALFRHCVGDPIVGFSMSEAEDEVLAIWFPKAVRHSTKSTTPEAVPRGWASLR